MQTASTSGARTTSRQSSWTRAMPNSFATRSPDSLERLATAASSTPGWARSLGRWWSRVLAPAPTKPTRIVWVLIARHGSTSRRLRRSASRGPPVCPPLRRVTISRAGPSENAADWSDRGGLAVRRRADYPAAGIVLTIVYDSFGREYQNRLCAQGLPPAPQPSPSARPSARFLTAGPWRRRVGRGGGGARGARSPLP